MRAASLLTAVLSCAATAHAAPPLPAFPGAEGFGALATGGRGGAIYHVTTLGDAGPGSFRDAVSKPGRTVVFDLAGVIHVRSRIAASSDLTLAGESAPGGGITLYGNGISFSSQHNIICRHLRFRGSSEMSRGEKTVNIASASNIILDHCSISWGRWDNLGITRASKDDALPPSTDITVQDCLISESIDPQRFGALVDIAHRITIVRNLWADHQSRNPKGEGDLQYINNVVYNFGHGGYVGSHSTGGVWRQDLIANVFIAGPSSANDGHGFLGEFTGGKDPTTPDPRGDIVHQSGNLVDLDRDGTLNPRAVTDADLLGVPTEKGPKSEGPRLARSPQNLPPTAVHAMTATEAFLSVTANSGASPRDAIDARVIADVLSLGKAGAIIHTEADAGGIQPIARATAPKDSDGDGIPDDYELAHGLNPNDPADGSKLSPSGYSMLEIYLHQRANPR